MDRRTFLGTLAGGLLAAPLGAGAQPAGQPTKFELVINLKTAKALALTAPVASAAGGSGH